MKMNLLDINWFATGAIFTVIVVTLIAIAFWRTAKPMADEIAEAKERQKAAENALLDAQRAWSESKRTANDARELRNKVTELLIEKNLSEDSHKEAGNLVREINRFLNTSHKD